MMTPKRRPLATVLSGGALVCVGTVLPWMSFFAGLQSLSGLDGLYGRMLFASGVVAVLLGTAMLRRHSAWLLAGTAALGISQTLFIVWLLCGLRSTLRGLGMHAMLLARPGPGLFVALAGALLVSSAMISPASSRARPRRNEPGVASYRHEKILN